MLLTFTTSAQGNAINIYE